MMIAATLLAAIAGAIAVPAVALAARDIRATLAQRARPTFARLAAALERVLQPFRLAGEQGLIPTDRERGRLQVLAGMAGLVLGAAVLGPVWSVPAGIGCAWLGGRSLSWRRERYRQRVDAGVATAALALADALTAGQSVRAAISAAAEGLGGAIGSELQRVARELEMGAATEDALEQLRIRCRSRRVDLIVAAIRVQRRSGGALAGLLREIAGTIEEQDRVLDEARAASAQARFTSAIVALLPLFGLLLGELASPGFATQVKDSAAGLWLLGAALALQAVGLALVRRLSRVRA